MINDINHNQTCGFAEQMVSFLYDEIAAAEKSKFQSHLISCSACADEIAEFSAVRSSIQEWRVNDFESLSTPAFKMALKKNTPAESRSWLDSIRAYLSFYPAVSAAAVLIALSIFALIWFTSKSSQNLELASNTGEKTIEKSSSPVKETSITKDSNETTDDAKVVEVVNKAEQQSAPVKNEILKTAPAPVKVSERTNNIKEQIIKSKKPLTVVAERVNDKKTPKSLKKNVIPSATDEEAEDDALRLSDILDEIGMR